MQSLLTRRCTPLVRHAPRAGLRQFTTSEIRRSFMLYDIESDEEPNLRVTEKMPTPGLMYVTSMPKDTTSAGQEKYNRFYNDEHLSDVLKTGETTGLAVRYQDVNRSNEQLFLALYPLKDATFLQSDGITKLIEDTRKSSTYGGDDIYDHVDFVLRPYEKIQTFEGSTQTKPDGKSQVPTIVCVAMEPGAGEEADFEDWYRKQHLDMLSMCRHYQRTTRYKRLDGQKPRYLAVHEWACKPDDLPADQIKRTTSTEWSTKIIGEAEVFNRNVYELIEAQGDTEELRL